MNKAAQLHDTLDSWLGELVDPHDGEPLRLVTGAERDQAASVEGWLQSASGKTYPIIDGIPRFVEFGSFQQPPDQRRQEQTAESFGYKWQQRDSYDSPAMLDAARTWMVQKYGFDTPAGMRDYFASRRRILDAGCGSGFSSSTWLTDDFGRGSVEWFGADISTAVDVAKRRLGNIPNTRFVQADVFHLPFAPASFDTIFSEGVLHHTPSTEGALKSIAPLLSPGGEILFYVYRRKAPIREFTDDYVRARISDMPPERAWDELRPLTRLGQALAELQCQIDVPEDVQLLEIKAGRYDVQRLIYYHIAKLFWNPALSFEENHHVNFDWYHPKYAHRQTADEVRRWCADALLEVERLYEDESGITVRAIRRAAGGPGGGK